MPNGYLCSLSTYLIYLFLPSVRPLLVRTDFLVPLLFFVTGVIQFTPVATFAAHFHTREATPNKERQKIKKIKEKQLKNTGKK
jgi:hypothetical protein